MDFSAAGNTSIDAVDGLRGGRRVQRAEHQVARFRGGQRQADGLEVTHLADQDDVRVLAQGAAQGLGKTERIPVHLALVDQALACCRARIRSGPRS
jgi:hypothetical protein